MKGDTIDMEIRRLLIEYANFSCSDALYEAGQASDSVGDWQAHDVFVHANQF